MKKVFVIIIAFSMIVTNGLYVDEVNSAGDTEAQQVEDELSEELIGFWKTDPVLGQLGHTISRFIFNEDGTFITAIQFIDSEMPDLKTSGTYEIIGDKLVTKSENKEHISRFLFEDDVLVVNDGTEEFRYHRIIVKK